MKNWLPEEIKGLRLRKDLTQSAFGELVGVTRVYMNYLEKGVKKPSKTLKLLLERIERETRKKEVSKHGKTDKRPL